MAIVAANSLYIAVASAGSGGTAPGGATAPAAGFTLTSPSDISAYVTGVDSGLDVAPLGATTFGSGGYEAFVAGLKSGRLSLELLNDWAAAALNSLIGINGTKIAVGGTGYIEVKASSASRSTSNPSFVAFVINTGWSPYRAQVGQLPTVSWAPQVTGGAGELTA